MNKSEYIEQAIVEYLRNGVWRKGDRLPSEHEMCKKFGVSLTTLRIAMKTIANRGLIERRQRQGSFVLRNVSSGKVLILANFEIMVSAVGYFYRTLTGLLQTRLREEGYEPELCVATGIQCTDFAENLRLEDRADLDELAGVIVTLSAAPKLRELLERHNIPLVQITATGYDPQFRPVKEAHVYTDLSSLFIQGLDVLAGMKINDFALMVRDSTRSIDGVNPRDRELLRGELLRRNLSRVAENILLVPWTWDCGESYRVFREWWKKPNRPKVIFCLEDALCKVIMRAVWELGIRIPEDLAILTHDNGEYIHSPTTLASLKIDIAKVTEGAIKLLKTLRRNEPPEPVIIRPEFCDGKSLSAGVESVASMRPELRVEEKIIYRDQPFEAGNGCWKTCADYRFATGNDLFEIHSDLCGRDRYDCFQDRFSSGGSGNFTGFRELFRHLGTEGMVYRMSELVQELDANSNSVFRFFLRGTFCNDAAEEAGIHSFLRTVRLYCARSFDGGYTFDEPEDLSQNYTDWYGEKRTVMISCSQVLSCRDGLIRVPCYLKDVDKFECSPLVLTGRPCPGGRMDWRWGGTLPSVPDGGVLTESSIVETDAGALAILCRADGGKYCRKYVSFSRDGGMSWRLPEELRYADGTPVFSPGSCGRVLRHSCGRIFYIANILEGEHEPHGSRQTLSIVELDGRSMAAKRETLTRIDGIALGESCELAISNFTCYEDRRDGRIVVLAPKAFRYRLDYGDCVLMRYRIAVG